MDKITEREIISGLRKGSRQSWLRLYDAYAESVWKHVARLMGSDSSGVADVVQETFLAAGRSAGTYKSDRASLGTWLNGIARKQIALYYRKHDSGVVLERLSVWCGSLDVNCSELLDSKAEIAPEILEAEELACLVRHVLRQLSGKYQTVLLLKYVDNESTKEIAQKLGCTPIAVTARLARAKKTFRKIFAKATSPAQESKEVLS